MKTIRLRDYDPLWPTHFQQLHDLLWPVVADLAHSLEHIGSTAVPGLAAKPVIDLDIVLRLPPDLPLLKARLAALGYQPRGDLGIVGREAFRAPSHSPFAHHLYACPLDGLALRNHLVLRDHLRRHPEARAAYEALKRKLATRHPHDA